VSLWMSPSTASLSVSRPARPHFRPINLSPLAQPGYEPYSPGARTSRGETLERGNSSPTRLFGVLTLDRGYRVTRVDRNPSFVDHPSAGSLLAAPPLRDLLSPAA
jgi:hypothetical protein